MINLNDKVIVITGASSGIGKSCAVLCSQLGAKVAMVSRNEEKLLEVKKELSGEGHQIFPFNLMNYDSFDDLVANIVNGMGKISGLVYSAGVEYTRPLKVINNEQLNDIYQLNVFSAIALSKTITKRKFIGNELSLVFISSIVGILGEAGKIGYASSKGALLSAGKSMAIELAPKGIRVNSILPALVETPMSTEVLASLSDEAVEKIKEKHPLGFGKPVDIAKSVAFLLSNASSWITGTELIVDGGFSAS